MPWPPLILVLVGDRADIVIVGGGIIGLTLARRIRQLRPDFDIILLDKEVDVALHASGRNSGVLHAGFYYAPDSLKARLTRRGNQLLHGFIEEQGLPLLRCGKVVVAADDSQLPALKDLAQRAEANDVQVELVDESQLRELEPLARTAGSALWSPTTSVSDPMAVAHAMADELRATGVSVRLGTRVRHAGPGFVITDDARITAGHIVNAAGLHADVIGKMFGFCDDYRMMPFKGLYWYSTWPPGHLRRHVYPVPDPRNPFLGVHATVTVDGKAKVGPTAIPGMWREDYGGVSGFRPGETAEALLMLSRFLRSEHHDAGELIRSEVPKYSRKYLVNRLKPLIPSVRAEDFPIRGRVGVRAQLFDLRRKRLEMDFVVRGDDRSTHVLNAVSPAWTSSLAFAEYVVDDMLNRMGAA